VAAVLGDGLPFQDLALGSPPRKVGSAFGEHIPGKIPNRGGLQGGFTLGFG
jgi:hypothetical protein